MGTTRGESLGYGLPYASTGTSDNTGFSITETTLRERRGFCPISPQAGVCAVAVPSLDGLIHAAANEVSRRRVRAG